MDGTSTVKYMYVSEFPYLGALIESYGRMGSGIERRTTKASKAIHSLCRSVFMDRDLMLQRKRKISRACVLSILRTHQNAGSPLGSARESWSSRASWHLQQEAMGTPYNMYYIAIDQMALARPCNSHSESNDMPSQVVMSFCVDAPTHCPTGVCLVGCLHLVQVGDQEKPGETSSKLACRGLRSQGMTGTHTH